ncbi:MAG: septum formation initiator family protein [Candidatus Marinimicrobia bacterium]|jgi:cell division protein FtsB|nr:septum formation initiator family protein [Candidatus Neomarinimicrobiota bacterium]|tara:strand:+ start:1380 stop:1661 length:282 start_codon:yes stop_codon:yes gene_type:complete
MNFKIPSLTNVLFGCLSVGCILLLLFSDRGFLTLWNLKKEKIEIQQDINSLRQQIASLEKEAEKLEFDEKYIEKIAREKFRMSKPGEKVFKVE